MSEANETVDGGNSNDNLVSMSKEDFDKAIKERIDTELANIKKSLDNSYRVRDEALAKLKEKEEAERAAERKRLEEEGKHKELYELQLAEERARIAALTKANTELTRDATLREALRGLDFRNKTAHDMAFKEIVGELVQNQQGQWVHKSGSAITDYVDSFSKQEDQSFLFKPKASSGAGSSESSGAPSTTSGKKSLFELSQAEVLKMASEGKFGAPPPI